MSATVTRPTPTTTVKFHFSLWVTDLSRTVAFYRILFGQDPHKHYADYAKFEVDDPPMMLSFLQYTPPAGASLNHAGLRLATSEQLVAVQARLEGAGYPTEREDGVECCYALQTKFWATDPDGVRWEVYTVHEDIDHYGPVSSPEPPPPEALSTDGTWTVAMSEDFPERIPFADASLDSVRLTFSFNTESFRQDSDRSLAELARVLKPGGKISVETLVGPPEYPARKLNIPGLLHKLKHVPVQTEPLEFLARAGFQEIEIGNWKEVTCVDDGSGISFRTMTATAKRGPQTESTAQRFVRYVGEFRQAIDDDGTSYPRGVRVMVTETAWNRLKNGSAAGQFEFFAEVLANLDKIASVSSACCEAEAAGESTPGTAAHTVQAGAGASYYQPQDLPRFYEINRVNPKLADSFFAYFNQVMEEGHLTRREKYLISLAVAHALKCPYCIDCYTKSLHNMNVSEAEMSEAVHVASAMAAGITLVHSVQMMNKIDQLDASHQNGVSHGVGAGS